MIHVAIQASPGALHFQKCFPQRWDACPESAVCRLEHAQVGCSSSGSWQGSCWGLIFLQKRAIPRCCYHRSCSFMHSPVSPWVTSAPCSRGCSGRAGVHWGNPCLQQAEWCSFMKVLFTYGFILPCPAQLVGCEPPGQAHGDNPVSFEGAAMALVSSAA